MIQDHSSRINKNEPRGDLLAAMREAETKTARVVELDGQRREYYKEIDELEGVRGKLAQIEAERLLEKAQQALTDAQAQADEIERLRQRDDATGRIVALKKAEFQNAREHSTARRSLIETVGTREKELTAAQDARASLETQSKELSSRFEAAKSALDTAVAGSSAADARLALSQKRAKIEALNQEIADLDYRISEIDRLTAERADAEARFAEGRIDEPAFEYIQHQDSAVREARAALAAATTRLRFFPSGRQTVRKNGKELPAGEPIDVIEPTRFTLESFGAVEIEPGASAFAESRERLKAAETALSEALIARDAVDVIEAKAQLNLRKKAEADIAKANQLIKVLAPQGVDVLRSARMAKSEERSCLKGEFVNFSVLEIADPETEQRALDAAKKGELVARADFDAAQEGHRQHTTELAIAERDIKNAEQILTTIKEDLETTRSEISDTDLGTRLWVAQSALDDITKIKAETENDLANANLEEVEKRRDQARVNLNDIESKQRDLGYRKLELESSLAALGRSGIGEQLEVARGEEIQAIARRDRLRAEAEAWKLLVETLKSAERDAKKAFLEPVLQRVQPFLHLLFSGMRMTLEEETLEITEIARDGRREPYRTLSTGTREQLSILVRLAFAVYLRDKGYPAAVILDDALVYADANRFERMQQALRKAAETVQILILTCRPGDWFQLSAPIRRLAEASTAALALAE